MPTSQRGRTRVKIGLIEPEPIRVAGYRSIFEDTPHIEIIPTDMDGLVANSSLTMAMVGLHSSVGSFDVMSSIKAARPDLRILVMGSDSDDETIITAITAGAKGYLEENATPEQLEMAIDVVQSGSIWAPRRVLSQFVDRALHTSPRPLRRDGLHFTQREREVLKLLVAARSNREIAQTLGIEERTVKAHVARLMRKVGVENRIALSIHAVTHALVAPDRD
jgi:DNA-binding NarL/FixJ family response regulator